MDQPVEEEAAVLDKASDGPEAPSEEPAQVEREDGQGGRDEAVQQHKSQNGISGIVPLTSPTSRHESPH